MALKPRAVVLENVPRVTGWFTFVYLCGLCSLGCTTGGVVLLRDESNDAGASDGSSASAPESPDAAVPPLNDVSAVAAGSDHSCVLQAGSVYCAGANDKGQLGVTGATSRLTAVRAPANGTVVQLIAGYEFTCVRDDVGVVACAGSNALGQLGNDDVAMSERMLVVDLPAPALHVAAKFNTVCAVLEGNALRCWGSNDNNQCGTGTYVAGDKTSAPVTPNFSQAARSVAVGRGQTCVITLEDELWCWGSNGSSELGLGPDAPGLTIEPLRVSEFSFGSVAPGQDHTCAISTGGELYCWGDMLGADGHPGPMGHDDGVAHDVPARVGQEDDWVRIATDTFHSCGIRGDGEMWCWGRNAEGQLGVGSQDVVLGRVHVEPAARFLDVAVGRFHTCALRDDGITLCAGVNDQGELATGDSERRASFTPLRQSAVAP